MVSRQNDSRLLFSESHLVLLTICQNEIPAIFIEKRPALENKSSCIQHFCVKLRRKFVNK